MDHHLRCDHMALAESSEDFTKAVIHGMILEANSKIIQNDLHAHKKFISCINVSRDYIVLNVTSPEDITKKMYLVICWVFAISVISLSHTRI